MAFPQVSLTMSGSGLIGESFQKLPKSWKKKALKDAAQIIIASTKMGFMLKRGPDGEKWAPNVAWYSNAKGRAAPLSGPTQKRFQSPSRLKNKYGFAKINKKRMQNQLTKKINMTKEMARVDYQNDAKKRAAFTQVGGEGKIPLTNLKTGYLVERKVSVPARPHLGIANEFRRMGDRTDIQHILDIFDKMVTLRLGLKKGGFI